MADTFSTNIQGNVRGREDIDLFEEARDLINQAATENFRNQELARMQGSLPIAAKSQKPIVNMPFLGNQTDAYAANFIETGPSLAPQGIASMFPDPTGGYATRGDPRESFAARDVAIEEIKNMNPLVKGIHNAYARMFGLGTDDQGNITPEALIDLKKQTQQTKARNDELAEQRRKDQERAERAAMLATQNQPIDPCPEGYRIDPRSKVCVPTDDMPTDPVPGTGRV